MKKVVVPKVQATHQDKIDILTAGKQGTFWKIIQEAMQETKDYIDKQLEDEGLQDLDAEQYKFTTELLRAKKKYLDKLLQTPENMIEWFGIPEEKRKNFDPYGH